jgi:hypothetical protein
MASKTRDPAGAESAGLGNVFHWQAIDTQVNSPDRSHRQHQSRVAVIDQAGILLALLDGDAEAIVTQIRAIVDHAKKNHAVCLRVRCALRDAIVELEQERIAAAERFLASRRGAA